jgi:dihydroneopterin aldolase
MRIDDLPCRLGLNDLRLKVRLGCGAEERATVQEVSFDLAIRFPRPPEGSRTDELEGTICYGELSEKLRALCGSREFKLIEHLGWEAYRLLDPGPGRTLWLKVTKLKPPVADLLGGASFELGSA